MVNQVLEIEREMTEAQKLINGEVNSTLHPFILIGKNGIEEISPEKIVYSSSLQYGFGIFETLKVSNGELLFWHDHFWRMYNTAKTINLPFYWNSYELLKQVKENFITFYPEGILRLYLFLSPLYGYKNINNVESKILCSLLTEKSIPPSSAKLYISDIRRYSRDYLVKHKLTQRAHLILVCKMYQEAGAYEGLLLNENNHITEGTRSNIFFYKNGRFYTPSLETGILHGVTRKKVIEIIKEKGYEIEEGFYTPDDLISAEEIFITFTTFGIVPIKEITGYNKTYKVEKSVEIAKKLDEKMNKNNEYLRVLFVCRENSIRSIMAECIMNNIAEGKIKAYSAGLASTSIHPLTVEILKKESLYTNSLYSKKLTEEVLKEVDYVITVCDISNCVYLKNLDPKTTLIKWTVEEPEDTPVAFYNTYKKIASLCAEFKKAIKV